MKPIKLMTKAVVELIQCDNCGRIGISINDYRITRHKCSGAWTTVHSEEIDVVEIREQLTANRCRIARKARAEEVERE